MPPMTLPVVGTIHPWQLVFFAVGLPGLLLAAVMATVTLTQREGQKPSNALFLAGLYAGTIGCAGSVRKLKWSACHRVRYSDWA
jgi:hypothetical protein